MNTPMRPSSDAILQLARQARQAQPSSSLDKLILNIALGARCCFAGSDLLVESMSNPGKVYTVDSAGCCDCRATRPCWHQRLRRLLEEQKPVEAPAAPLEQPSLGARLAIARRALRLEAI